MEGDVVVKVLLSEGRLEIAAELICLGEDLCVTLTGGRAHIGAVALGIPRSSLADASEPSASVSVMTVTGHKDDEPAREMASALASSLGRRVTVVCGIHYDNITPEEIAAVMKLTGQAAFKLIGIAAQ